MSNDQQVADVLANYFSEMFTREDLAGISYQEEMENSAWKDTDVDLSSVAVLQKLRNLKADKSPGPDGIHPVLLKSCAEVVAEPLSLIYQASFDVGISDVKRLSVYRLSFTFLVLVFEFQKPIIDSNLVLSS